MGHQPGPLQLVSALYHENVFEQFYSEIECDAHHDGGTATGRGIDVPDIDEQH